MSFTNNTDSPDWLGGMGYGGQLLVNDTNHVIPGNTTITFGPFFVGNVETTIVNFTNDGPNAPTLWTVGWSATPTGPQYAHADYLLNSPLPDRVVDALTNKGPYMTVSVQTLTGAGPMCDTIVSVAKGPNAELTAQGSMVLLRDVAVAVAAGGSTSIYCSFHVPGPAHVSFYSSVAIGVQFTIQEWTLAGMYLFVARYDNISIAGSCINDNLVLGNNSWRVDVANTTGAGITASACIVSAR